jgi:AcrR family transcriptional regulator
MPKQTSSAMPRGKKSSRKLSLRDRKSASAAETAVLPAEEPSQDGRRARGDLTRARVLGAAVQAASVLGLNGLTIGQVAEAAGVSKGHLAILFGNRESLQLATLDAAVEIFQENVGRAAEAAKTPEEKLRLFCLGWFRYVKQRVLPGGCLVTAATSEFRTIDGAVRDKLLNLRERRAAYLRGLAESVIAAKRPKAKADPRTEASDFVYRILAYEAAANVAWLLGDGAAFEHARRETERAVVEVCG